MTQNAAPDRYIIVGGKPFTDVMTSTLTFLGLQVDATARSLEEAQAVFQNNWDICGGLLLIID